MAFRKTTRGRKSTAKRTMSRRTATPRATTRRSATKRGAIVRVKVWSASEISMLRKNYRNTTNGKIAKSLGRTVASVRAKAGALNLKKNKNFLSMVAKTAGNGGMKTRRGMVRKASSRKTVARKSSARRTTRRTSTMKRKTTRRR